MACATHPWAGCGACLLAYALLIPRYGLWGAVAATILGFTVMASFAFWLSQRVRPFRYEYARWAKLVGCAAASALPTLLIRPDGFWAQVALAFASAGSFLVLLHAVRFATEGEREAVWHAFRQLCRL